ncbi:methyltransferase domain-containing protein [Chitinimonas koreensis]|uniref:methyltransferase domain-containing protein n=1 Tax=Chitinimonas koreensis TaxID=356302 RepID=UPI00041D09ED|nr:methyltransferase domain-containing protein [Chitinimonas koreensis]QNM96968.1 methyltransferase domain-containing protein [Chitinimonas koreensis]
MSAIYNNQYSDTNVYGHVVDLCEKYSGTTGIHLDIGCGYGAIAERIKQRGIHYVGVDVDSASLQNLSQRGFETHRIDLQDIDSLQEGLSRILAGRPLACMSIIDTLEHIKNDIQILEVLRSMVEHHPAALIVSVPNVSHRDISFKSLCGRWDYTEAGLLDHTHVIHHTESLLTAMTNKAGWFQVGEADIRMEMSDQHFPKGNLLLSPNTLIGQYLRQIKHQADKNDTVNQLVRAYLPAAPQQQAPVLQDRSSGSDRPFLSVVTRTQGRRCGALRDMLLCLAAQTDQDFELIVVAHKVSVEQQIKIERLIEEQPPYMREKTRLVLVDRVGRAAPLNEGFAAARGRYVAMLDDDDVVFGHWIETFKQMDANDGAGCMLRTVTAEQDIEAVEWRDKSPGLRTVGPIKKSFPSEFDLFAHLTQNFTPIMGWAIPSSVYHELGCRFDETLNTAEDWDFEMRAAFLCGVRSNPEITSIYRKWKKGHSSFSEHSQQQWQRDYERILISMDAEPRLFPAGSTKLIRDQQRWIRKLEQDIAELQTELRRARPQYFIGKSIGAARFVYRGAKKVAKRLGIRRLVKR